MHIFIVHYASIFFSNKREKKEVEKSSDFRMGETGK